ncbi:hypothetical protein Q4561_05320 [Alteromonas sp. 1_MG-2023]|uniref:hypothetical protein n=1 Tax=Alteromonas sp. 1_MG-2023 TaxID=3062669 RepID=UPI0026E1886D|nr:hypothetical protein [Alteromonas sp. 1_MG-2023]MDO6566469.1 hypothetical protein [Alteromonas sp. 1_MG-2023]
MARLSQRAMNNVVIVAMLVMIALFNLDSFLPKRSVPELSPLLPPDAYVLKIEHDGNKLERNGQQWRQVSSEGELSITASDQIAQWQAAQLKTATLVDDAFQSVEPIVVVIWLAGQPNGHVFAFYANTHPVTVKYNGMWYTLENAELKVLLPWVSEPNS